MAGLNWALLPRSASLEWSLFCVVDWEDEALRPKIESEPGEYDPISHGVYDKKIISG